MRKSNVIIRISRTSTKNDDFSIRVSTETNGAVTNGAELKFGEIGILEAIANSAKLFLDTIVYSKQYDRDDLPVFKAQCTLSKRHLIKARKKYANLKSPGASATIGDISQIKKEEQCL